MIKLLTGILIGMSIQWYFIWGRPLVFGFYKYGRGYVGIKIQDDPVDPIQVCYPWSGK